MHSKPRGCYRQTRLIPSEVDGDEFYVICRAGIKIQAADAFLRLSTIEEDQTPIEDALPVMSVICPPKDKGKGCIKPNNVSDDCNEPSANVTSTGLPTAIPSTTPRMDTCTSTLVKLFTEQAKDAFCHQAAGTAETLSSYERQGFFVCTASLEGAVQAVVKIPFNQTYPR